MLASGGGALVGSLRWIIGLFYLQVAIKKASDDESGAFFDFAFLLI